MERMIREPARDTPVVTEADVVVVGGGTAGLPAAVAAARCGARVVLVERYGFLGGLAVGGLVITIPKWYEIGGIGSEIYERLLKMGGAAEDVPEHYFDQEGNIVIDSEMMKCLADEMVEEARVEPLYHSPATAVVMDGQRISALIVENKSGRQAITGKVFVDCTGDADLAVWAGAPWVKGDEQGKMLRVSLMYNVVNASLSRWVAHRERQNLPRRHFFTEVHPGEVNCCAGPGVGEGEDGRAELGAPGSGDGTDARDLTRMEMALRRCVLRNWEQLRSTPGFEGCFISQIAPQLGIRETRRIVGEVVWDDEAWEGKERFPDSIGLCCGRMIPYRALVPRRVENLLVAGRCISTSRLVQGFSRIIPPCMTTGQAAGVAAAQAADGGLSPRALESADLQAELSRQGLAISA